MFRTVIKTNVMNADWFLRILKMFIGTFIIKADIPPITFAAIIQYLKEGAVSLSTFYCDVPIVNTRAKHRGYKIDPLANFTEEKIREQWEIKDFHWEIEYYVYFQEALEPIATLAFYSYFPAAEIISDGSARSHINIVSYFGQDITLSVESSDEAANVLRKEMNEAMSFPPSDPRFDALRG